ncbi:MAG: hypothetical protein HY520_00130 [Candidatus Aenigmarchaeota archaeon]|nr:hypothetical protein [Candidatus Aenigmarchaeota archaeon]
MDERNQVRVSVALHAAAALAVAVLSPFLAGLGAIAGVLVLVALGGLVARAFRQKAKWWLANGLIVYLFLWLVAVIYLFNLGLL